MCKIVNFPTNKIQNTSGYKNLVALFEVCNSVESCNLYLESVEQLYSNGDITESEMLTLRRIGRQKRIELATPKQKPQTVSKPGTYIYTTEMGQQKPECQMEAGLCYYGKHYWIRTALTLKGRGITEDAPSKQCKGLKNYTVTERAFEKLKEQYTISMECRLD